MEPRLVLASASPRRARILESLGIPFRIAVSAVDETLRPDESGEAAVERLARDKARSVAAREPLPVLAADTEVLCDGRILGKPGSAAEAMAMLARLSGRTHDVVTGVCLIADGTVRSAVERTTVTFAPLSEVDRAWYVATGEPMDKAGAYAIQGQGARFIEGIKGDYFNVVGLPLRLLYELFREQ